MIDPRAYMLEANNNGGLQGFGQGLQLGAAYAQSQRAQAAAQQEAQAKEQMNADLSAFAQMPNKTAEDYATIVTKYPNLSEPYKRAWDMQDQAKKDSNFKIASQVYAATKSGQPEIAKGLLQTQAEAYRNSGLEQDAKAMETLASLAEMNPDMLLTSVGIQLAATNPEQFASVSKALGEESRAQELQPYEVSQAGANIQKTRADIGQTQAQTGLTQQQTATERQTTAIKQAEAENAPEYFSLRNEQSGAQIDKIRSDQRLGMLNYQLNSDKLDADLEWRYEELDRKGSTLDGAGQKQVNDAVLESTTLATIAQQQKDLANKARNSEQWGGLISAGWEGLKGALGVETERSDMVREVTKMINSEVVKGLPPGPATDKDIEIIKKGFPPATADGKTIGRFLDAMSNVNMAAAANKQMQAEWQSQNGSLGNSKRDLDVLGIKVPKGTTYQKFASSNMGKAVNQIGKMNSQQAISRGTASYMKYGQ